MAARALGESNKSSYLKNDKFLKKYYGAANKVTLITPNLNKIHSI